MSEVKRKKLYACFVDFRKAFDSLWHVGLMYKLFEHFNIGGKFYCIIRSMYKNAKSCVKLKEGITDTFRIQKGIKQGDTLSPYLFNLYLNDINKIFNCDENCPPLLMSKLVGCLLYADDLLIISQTKEGLQHSLDNLYDYCNMWKLQLNVKKAKVVIFSKRKVSTKIDFKFGSEVLKVFLSF